MKCVNVMNFFFFMNRTRKFERNGVTRLFDGFIILKPRRRERQPVKLTEGWEGFGLQIGAKPSQFRLRTRSTTSAPGPHVTDEFRRIFPEGTHFPLQRIVPPEHAPRNKRRRRAKAAKPPCTNG